DHQCEERTEDESEYHRPRQRTPECLVVATEEDVRIQFGEHLHKVDVQTYSERYQTEGCSHSREDNRCHPGLGSLRYGFLRFDSLLNEEVGEFYQENSIPNHNTSESHNTHTGHDYGYLHLEQ